MAVSDQRIVLLGKTRVGKSSLANILIKDDVFEINHFADSGTSKCQKNSTTVSGRSITVIDTPGFFGTNLDEKKHKDEIVRLMTEASPGPHVFLILLKVEKYTEHEKTVINKISEYFSEESFRFSAVVFTHGDQLPEGMKIKMFVDETDDLRDLVKRCGDRCHVIDSKYWKRRQNNYRNNEFQVAELFKTIDEIIEKNNGGYYTNEMLQKVEEQIAEEEKHIRESSDNLTNEEIKEQAKEAAFRMLSANFNNTAGVALLGALCGGITFLVLAPALLIGAAVVGAAVGAAAWALGSQPAAAGGSRVSEAHQRIVLLGKTGVGKSSFANILIKDNVFEINHFANTGTSKCQTKSTTVSGRSITVIDTPGFFDTKMDEKTRKERILRFMTESSPGPHVFLFVLRVKEYTEEEKTVIKKISEYFSEESFRFAAVVFTHGDQLPEGTKIEEFVDQTDDLRDLVKKCGDRCHVIDNKYWKKPLDDYRNNEFQVAELFETINKIIEENNGGYYTNKMYQKVEKLIAEEEKRIRESLAKLAVKKIRERATEDAHKKLSLLVRLQELLS